jgi:hypothetical protein
MKRGKTLEDKEEHSTLHRTAETPPKSDAKYSTAPPPFSSHHGSKREKQGQKLELY